MTFNHREAIPEEIPLENQEISTMDWVRRALDQYEAPLVRYAQRYTGNLDTARDLVQETFLRLCRADRRQVEGYLAPWLYRVCRNLALDQLRKEQRMVAWDENAAASLPSGDTPPSAVAERAEASSRIERLLDPLPKNQQEVIRLKFQESLSYEEISRVTGLSVSNVGYLLHTGIKTIRKGLADGSASRTANV